MIHSASPQMEQKWIFRFCVLLRRTPSSHYFLLVVVLGTFSPQVKSAKIGGYFDHFQPWLWGGLFDQEYGVDAMIDKLDVLVSGETEMHYWCTAVQIVT